MDVEGLRGRLTNPRWTHDFDNALNDVVSLSELADQLLAEALDALQKPHAYRLANALGQFRGPAGDAALFRALDRRGPGSQDVRTAALGSFADRQGSEATLLLRDALTDRLFALRYTAIRRLALVGNATAWGEAFAWLKVLGPRQSRTWNGPEAAMAICYLAQHLDTQDQVVQLVEEIRMHWGSRRGDEQRWLAEHWPDATPAGPDPSEARRPDQESLRAWALNPEATLHSSDFGSSE